MMDVAKLHEVHLKDHIGDTLYISALVKNTTLKSNRNNQSKYLDIELVDQDVTQHIKIWNVTDTADQLLTIGEVYIFEVTVGTWKGNPQLEFKQMFTTEEDAKDYLPAELDITPYMETIYKSFEVMNKASVYYQVTRKIYDANEEKFKVQPAAKTYHHNIKGGLVLHTATMLRAAAKMTAVYPTLNWDLLASAIILHDIGKVKEYHIDEQENITYTPMGSLKGHIVWAITELECVARELGVQDTNEMLALINAVASHHGKLEYGSPVLGYTLEAKLINHLDMFDAEAYRMTQLLKSLKPGELSSTFINGSYEGVFKV